MEEKTEDDSRGRLSSTVVGPLENLPIKMSHEIEKCKFWHGEIFSEEYKGWFGLGLWDEKYFIFLYGGWMGLEDP